MHTLCGIVMPVLFCVGSAQILSTNFNPSIENLEPGQKVIVSATTRTFSSEFKIFCYSGRPKFLIHYFHTIQMQIDVENDDFVLYEGWSSEEVKTDYENKRTLFSLNLFSNKKKNIKLNPFNQTCLGIDTSMKYSLQLNLIRIDFWKVICLAAGLILFFAAPKLSENTLFYYITGILLGIFASFLVIVYLASKLIPGKPMMYGVMIGGWTLGIYFAQMMWENIQLILVTYQAYAFWYVVITGFISFVICYRLGPPSNKKSKNLIKWGLQLGALISIFFSSDFQEASAGIDIVILLVFYIPKSWITKGKGLWYRKFPSKRKLLTNEEYYEEGVRETIKALEELKSFCSSPECKQWRTIMKLKDPKRFASFMEGSSHIMDEEIMDYEVSQHEVSDDEDELQDEHRTDDNVYISEDDDDIDRRVTLPKRTQNSSHNYNNNIRSINNYLNSTPKNNANISIKKRAANSHNGSARRNVRNYDDSD